MAIECEQCHQVGSFYILDGITFCNVCGTESKEHGQEAVIDDDTFGTFDGNVTCGFVSKQIGETPSKKKVTQNSSDKDAIAFSHTDAYTRIVKLWTEEVIALGANPSLKHLVKLLWLRYLDYIGLVSSNVGRAENLSAYPSFRDLQVTLTGRKIITNVRALGKQVKGSHVKKLDKELEDENGGDDDDDGKTALKRRRKRRKFLSSVEDGGNLSDCSFGASSVHDNAEVCQDVYFLDESCGSDAFSLSLSNFESPSMPYSHSPKSRSGEEGGLDYEQEKLYDEMLLQNLSLRQCKNYAFYFDPGYLKLSNVFVLFALAVLLNKNNVFTLSDLIFWARGNAISYETAISALPSQMKLRGMQDMLSFVPWSMSLPPLDHLTLRKRLHLMGGYLHLDQVDFCAFKPPEQAIQVMKRYLKEVSLPDNIANILYKSLPLLLTGGLKFTFTDYEKMPKEWKLKGICTEYIPSLDVFCMALILMALKSLFGMDGRTEEVLSTMAKQQNDVKGVKKGYFVFSEWLVASRARIASSVKHCNDLRERYSVPLCPFLQRSTSATASYISKVSEKVHLCNRNPDTEALEQKMPQIKKMIEKTSAQYTKNVINTMDVSCSLTPLHDFSISHIALSSDKDRLQDEERLQEEEVDIIKKLVAMNFNEILVPSKDDFQKQQATIDEERTFFIAGYLPNGKAVVADTYEHKEHANMKLISMSNSSGRYFQTSKRNLEKKYWLLKTPKVQKYSECFNEDYELHLFSSLPSNFCWVLKYLAATVDAHPAEVYFALLDIETFIFEKDPMYFGEIIKSVDPHASNLRQTYHHDLQDRLF